MNTRIETLDKNRIDENIIKEAGDILKEGGLVAFPTETVYGLGANALNKEGATKTYAAKGRPSDNPLIIHIARMEDLDVIAKNVPDMAKKVAEKFWPGPLTMVFEKTDLVPYETTGGLETVAVRMPSEEIALALIQAGGGFVSAPSANTSGRPSPTAAEHVAEDMTGKIEMILDGGSVDIGVESTIVDMTVIPPMILRPGAITKEMLEEIVGEVVVDKTILNADSKVAPRAPGMKYRHYAPKAELSVVEGRLDMVVSFINTMVKEKMDAGYKVGVIATEETLNQYKDGVIKCVGTREDEMTIAGHLYGILREFDGDEVDYIYSESFEADGIGSAVMNRLLKAAGHHVISV